MRLRQYLRDPVDHAGDPRGNLRQVPPVLHGQAKAGRYGWSRGALPSKVPHGESGELKSMQARLRQALAQAEEVARLLADPETARQPAQLKLLGREHARLESIRQTSERLARLTAELAQAR